MTISGLWIYGAALAAGALGALMVAIFGRQWSLLDRPNERSSHQRPTPRGGGIGLLAALVLCAIFFPVPPVFWAPAALLSLISFLGDRFDLRVTVRLGIQFSLAAWFLYFAAVDPLCELDTVRGLVLSIFFMVFIVGTANFYNFMDGINGMAGISGVAAFGLLGAYGLSAGRDAAQVTVCFSLAAACAGFLPFNLPRARVFMGDGGSVLLGFVFACLVVQWSDSATEFLLLSGFLFLFYADELVTLRERIRDGESPFKAHRRHLYQVLANERKVPHWKVSGGYGLAQIVIGLSVWQAETLGLLAVSALLFFVLGVFMLINKMVKGLRFMAR
ncbi:MAG: glycosyltransferase family 4 protein [Thermodesulfobacteriota bacterium]